MAVTHLEVTRRSPFAFDYERVDGKLHFAVDPAHPANGRIVDLDKARRDAAGRVQFWADFVLLRPVDPSRANRRLLYYVVNRGQRVGVPYNRAPARLPSVPPTDEIAPGDGFLMRHGWTVAMCGWQWDVERQPGLMGLEAPQALDQDGQPIKGRIAVAFQPNESHAYRRLSHWPLHPQPGRQTFLHQAYPAADLHEPTAELTVGEWRGGPSTVIPRAEWRFAREENGVVVDDDSHIWLDGGFQPGLWYEVIYTTRICPVVGTGLLATRDCVSWLRYESPYAEQIDFAFGNGRSQCGRFLRQFLYEGLNVDEQGRQVFDGVIPHVAGARRGEFNQRYGQPSETNARGFGGLPPFASDELLRRQRELGAVPKIFTTNTSSEYWRADCSLIHTDPSGTRDVEPPAEERIYVIAGHQHSAGEALVKSVTPIGARGANHFNVVDGSTVERACLVNMDRWVSDGIEPPPSAFPRLANGTAITREAALTQLGALPGISLLDPAVLPRLRHLDLGPDVARGIARLPVVTGEPFVSYVSALDADGNEVAGVRVPDVAVPVAAHTGWVPRDPSTGGAGQLLDMMGTTLPFSAETIGERYRDRDEYAEKARAAAEALVNERYLLEEDVELAVRLALERYDVLAPAMIRPASGVV